MDDSALVRRLVSTVLSADPDIEVVGTATDGNEAIARVDDLRPDAVTLDIEMPGLDGLGALAGIRARHPRLPVIMFSTLTEKGASQTLEALTLGASDYVTKPSNTGSIAESMTSVRQQLVPKIKALTGMRRMVATTVTVPAARVVPATTRPQVLLIGCSTGGPDALSSVLAALPADLSVPVLVVQHMPAVFTTIFAARLDRVSPLRVREAATGDVLRPGEVLVAPGDHHLRIQRSASGEVRAVLDQGDQVNFCRPAVDVLLSSAAQVYRGNAVVLILTGMGQDGMEGCRTLHDLGASIVVQDESTSVVWGMPGAVAGAGLADRVLPLGHIAADLTAMLKG